MENASKALLMAGGVLIGILILTLAVYLFLSFGAQSKEIHAQITANQLTQHNAKYNIYSGRNDVTIYDIVSVANQAKENNDYYQSYGEFTNAYKVAISLRGIGTSSTDNAQELSDAKKQELIQNYSGVNSEGELANLFSCIDVEYHESGRVAKVIFKLN